MYHPPPSVYPHTFSHGTNYNGPPPAKKPRSNLIITRYPPPPGYNGQAQPQPQPPSYNWAQSSGQSYPQPSYVIPQQYQHPQWPGNQQHMYIPTTYPPAQGYHPSHFANPAMHYGWQQPTSAQAYAPQPTTFNSDDPTYTAAPYAHSDYSSLGPLDGNGDTLPPQQSSAVSSNDLEADFFDECYFARYPDEVDLKLSLGWIEWRPPKSTTLALPATFAEAELEAIAPRNPRLADEPSISEYFTRERVGESLLSVRHTAHWNEVKDDSIYRDFPVVCEEVVTKREMRRKYRDRPDPKWTARAPVNDMLGQSRGLKRKSSIDAETIDSHHSPSTYDDRDGSAQQGDILGNLEAALHACNDHNEQYANAASAHSRAGSISSTAGERITRPKALAPIRDHAQDNILATLGVTGSPKMVYQTPGPAFAPAAASKHQDGALTDSRPNSAAGLDGPRHTPPTPSAPFQPQLPDQIQRPNTGSSHHAVDGSDFGAEDMDATPRPKALHANGRKRNYHETEDRGDADEVDDTTPKQNRKHPRVEHAYE